MFKIKKNKEFTPSLKIGISAFKANFMKMFVYKLKNKFNHYQEIKLKGRRICNANFSAGFILFLSLLITSVALSIAFSVFEIFIFQIVLTGNIKDSQSAFYAADSGLECVYYSDINKNAIPYDGQANITCNNENKTFNMAAGIGGFQLFFNNGPCAKILLDFNNPPPYTKKIQVFGRSKYAGGDCDAQYPRRVERGIEVAY